MVESTEEEKKVDGMVLLIQIFLSVLLKRNFIHLLPLKKNNSDNPIPETVREIISKYLPTLNGDEFKIYERKATKRKKVIKLKDYVLEKKLGKTKSIEQPVYPILPAYKKLNSSPNELLTQLYPTDLPKSN
jgi:hypothetical protein